MAPISFRNSKIVYYGPHSCENCGVNVAKMGREWGGTAFTYPDGPIYPNTEWYPHVCDPALVRHRRGKAAEERVTADFPNASALQVGHLGWVVLGEPLRNDVQSGHYLVVSANHTFADTITGAWESALERQTSGWPTWRIDLARYGPDARFGDDLERLPQCPA